VSSELVRYGVAPTRWSIDEKQQTLYLWTDLAVIEIRLTAQQIVEFKTHCTLLCNHYGRTWKDGMLCIPAKAHED
jgi:hypothetical protein